MTKPVTALNPIHSTEDLIFDSFGRGLCITQTHEELLEIGRLVGKQKLQACHVYLEEMFERKFRRSSQPDYHNIFNPLKS